MIEAEDDPTKDLVLGLENVRFDSFETARPIDLAVRVGEMAFLSRSSAYRVVLGLCEPAQGSIRFRGGRWRDRSVRETENLRRQIGVVFNPGGRRSSGWISNLNIDENVYLGASFEPGRSQDSLRKRAKEMAEIFGLVEGIPTTRSAQTSPKDLIRSQWIRALLPARLELLVLENPLESAPDESISPFIGEVKRIIAEGTSVLWVSEFPPPFNALGLPRPVFCNER